ncbi:hypothetical protein THASP1DRAFT_28991 [Thamnocephalis sphaerospora]|uniref:RGS domain-containing protein n=1 Tax=Thamnocephalis sphaerospora TaxID=78915 RepID=A0A4V1IWY9_9FUNG|nr:hypothetical protein THASP1DRAFT_28991 [Thamnocephalis sphaerospora]|eukprot:RKP09219.1 hypothetical protein THASP1DRAFT_28991 [Thamnocephalis sphaerospora]
MAVTSNWTVNKVMQMVFAAIWLPLLLLTSLLLVRYRELPELRHRSVRLSLLGNAACALLVLQYTLAAIFQPVFPCALLLWLPCIALPIWTHVLWCRGSNLIVLYRGNKAALDAAAYEEDGVWATTPRLTKPLAGPHRAPFDWRTALVMRTRFLFSSRAFAVSGTFALVCSISATAIVQSVTDVYTMQQFVFCASGWEFYPLYAIIGASLLLAIVTQLILLHGARDAYGLRTELLVALACITSCLPLMIAVDRLRVSQDGHWLGKISTSAILQFGVCTAHMAAFVVPTLRVWISVLRQRHSQTQATAAAAAAARQALREVMKDPVQLAEFRHFSLADLAAGNVLFHERYLRFCSRFLCERSIVLYDFEPMLEELEAIYRDFFDINATVHVDVSSATLRELHERFAERRLGTDVFDRAHVEVLSRIEQHTLLRYQQHSERGRSASLSASDDYCRGDNPWIPLTDISDSHRHALSQVGASRVDADK